MFSNKPLWMGVIGDENAVRALTKHCWICSGNVEKTIAPNATLLREIGVPMVICQMSESTWEQKMEAYRRCGLSEDEIMLAFRKHPICFKLSEKNIMSTMDSLVNMS